MLPLVLKSLGDSSVIGMRSEPGTVVTGFRFVVFYAFADANATDSVIELRGCGSVASLSGDA